MINIRKGIRLLSLLAFFILVSSLVFAADYNSADKSSLATAKASRVLSVNAYTQQPYNQLCWASTSAMIISYFRGDTYDRKVPIAQRIYGTSNFNRPGTAAQMINSIYYYSGVVGTLRYALSLSAAQTQINRNGPVATLIYWTSGGGHALALRGYSDSYLLINDPWDRTVRWYNYNYYLNNSSFRWGYSITFK